MELMADEYSLEEASKIVAAAMDVVRAERSRQRSKQGNLKMIAGALLFLFGLASTAYYFLIEPGTLFLPVGLLSLGAYLFFAGRSRI